MIFAILTSQSLLIAVLIVATIVEIIRIVRNNRYARLAHIWVYIILLLHELDWFHLFTHDGGHEVLRGAIVNLVALIIIEWLHEHFMGDRYGHWF